MSLSIRSRSGAHHCVPLLSVSRITGLPAVLEAKRDWGFAGDYVETIWLILQQDDPDDYVIATGETHSVREFVERAFQYAGLDWKKYVIIDERVLRPTEVNLLLGDFGKATKKFGWTPKVKFPELMRMMVAADLNAEGQSTQGRSHH